MPSTERVTVTLPKELLRRIDRLERNRSRFISDAVQRELARRRREELLRSIESPHQEGVELADGGLSDWAKQLPADEEGALVDLKGGRAVRWIEGRGWIEEGS